MRQALEELALRARPVAGRARRRLRERLRPSSTFIHQWTIAPEHAPEMLASAHTELQRLFYSHTGRPVHKWTHYLERYEQYFARYRGTSFGMLEIGVFEGGSLELWREYFGPDARILGIDINPECAGKVQPPNLVRIGSQDDASFLRTCVRDLDGPLDVVLDDGSHEGKHQWESFRTLFPLLADGGLYVIEDLHTAYWKDFGGGGVGVRGSGIGLVQALIDDMHAWYHDSQPSTPAKEWVAGVHVYDSMVFIEKRHRGRPGHILVGKPMD